MENILLYALIYCICNVVVVRLITYRMTWRLKNWAGAIVMSPILLPLIAVCYLFITFRKLRYRHKPRPIKGDLRKHLEEGCILNERNDVEFLKDFNARHGTSYTLKDVYGEKTDN